MFIWNLKKFGDLKFKNSIIWSAQAGSAISNGREPRSCLGRVFNIKLGSFVSKQLNWVAHTQPLLELKTRPRFRPDSWSLSVAQVFDFMWNQKCWIKIAAIWIDFENIIGLKNSLLSSTETQVMNQFLMFKVIVSSVIIVKGTAPQLCVVLGDKKSQNIIMADLSFRNWNGP